MLNEEISKINPFLLSLPVFCGGRRFSELSEVNVDLQAGWELSDNQLIDVGTLSLTVHQKFLLRLTQTPAADVVLKHLWVQTLVLGHLDPKLIELFT